jgi:hypothetical protein
MFASDADKLRVTALFVRRGCGAATWATQHDERCRIGWLVMIQCMSHADDPDYFDKDPAEVGFPSLMTRVVDATRAESITRFLRAVSLHVARPTQLFVGGSASLILSVNLTARIETVNVVDEVPAEIRTQYDLLESLAMRYGLRLAQFPSHYLPPDWQRRVRSVDVFDRLKVFIIDPVDVIAGKLFSTRLDDFCEVFAVAPRLDRDALVGCLRLAVNSLRTNLKLLTAATQNWYVLFGQPLPE